MASAVNLHKITNRDRRSAFIYMSNYGLVKKGLKLDTLGKALETSLTRIQTMMLKRVNFAPELLTLGKMACAMNLDLEKVVAVSRELDHKGFDPGADVEISESSSATAKSLDSFALKTAPALVVRRVTDNDFEKQPRSWLQDIANNDRVDSVVRLNAARRILA